MIKVGQKWICKVCGTQGIGKPLNPMGFCKLERGFPLADLYLCPCQEFDKKGNKASSPAKWELVEDHADEQE